MRSIRVAETAPQQSWGNVVALEPRFGPMIERLERFAAAHPGSYRRRVVMAGLLGYGVLGGTLLFFAALAGLMVVLMFTTHTAITAECRGFIIFGAIAIALVRALAVARV